MTENDSPLRSFIALTLPPEVQTQIATWQQTTEQQASGIRWTPAANLHLTLFFLGEQKPAILAKVEQAMVSNCSHIASFQLQLADSGVFPHRRRPRILWLGIQPQEPVHRLHEALSDPLQGLGCWTPEPRPFHPHITVGRARRGTTPQLPAQWPQVPQTAWNCGQIALMESRLYPQGAVYRCRYALPLATS